MVVYASLILIGTFFSSISQVMLKKSAQKSHKSRIGEYANPLVICAYIIFIGATFLSILAYKVIPLSMGPILESTSYIYVTLFGIVFFGEKVGFRKLIALILIVCGIAVYTLLG